MEVSVLKYVDTSILELSTRKQCTYQIPIFPCMRTWKLCNIQKILFQEAWCHL